VIVFDASTLVGAALKVDSVPERALLRAERDDIFALSPAVYAEIGEVLSRAKFARGISPGRRERIMTLLRDAAVWFDPAVPIAACRDPKDDKYLELALAAGADIIVSSDDDLLVLHPWRGVQILRPAAYLELP
jgi:putative PIN family toxin of toxin-antitoxin system